MHDCRNQRKQKVQNPCIYIIKDCEEVDVGKRGGEVLWGIEEEETFMRIYYMRLKKICFQLKGKDHLMKNNSKNPCVASL